MEHNFTFKGKPSVQADFQPSKEDLEYIDSIEKKYAKNKTLKSEEIVKYFDITQTKVRSKLLNDVLAKHNTYVDRREGVKGPGLSTVKETKKDPNRRNRAIQDAFNKAIEEAMQRTKQLREASVTITQAKQEDAKNSEQAEKLESINEDNDKLAEQIIQQVENIEAASTVQRDVAKPKRSPKSKDTFEFKGGGLGRLRARELFKEAVELVQTYMQGKLDLTGYEVVIHKNNKEPLPFNGRLQGNEITLKNIEIPLFPYEPSFTEEQFRETALHELIHVWQRQNNPWNGKSFESMDYFEKPSEVHARLAAGYLNNIDRLPKEKFEEVFKPEHLDPKFAEEFIQKEQAEIADIEKPYMELIKKRKSIRKTDDTLKEPKDTAITKQEAAKESEQVPVETPEQTSVKESVQGMPLFEEAAKTYDPIEDAQSKEDLEFIRYYEEKFANNKVMKGEEVDRYLALEKKYGYFFERQKKLKAQEDAARKAIEDAIKPVTNDIIESLDNQMPVTPSSSGGGGSGKKPPKTAKGSDDDGGDDEGDSDYFDYDGTYNPKRYFKAQVENLQRSFDSKLFGEKESTFFSSLQKVFDRASRTEDYDELEKLIDQETRLQSKILKDFETSNQNTANLLQAKAEEMIIRESKVKEEDRDTELIAWLENRLQEIKDVREATTSEYERIQRSIQTEIRKTADQGFAVGSIERDIRKLEQEAKDEEKILTKYNREFNKYVNTENQRLASEQAFEASKSFIDANKGKMPQEELLGKARKLFNKEFATYMQTASTEPELTTEQIVEKYQEGKGSFQQDAFKVKNAPSGFGQKSKYDPTQDNYVAPDIQSLSALAKDDSEKQRIKKNLAVWGTIQGVMGPLNQASKSPTGTGTVSGVMQNASTGAFALSAMGKAGPWGTLIAASLQTVSLLGEIADNTAKNVEAFSPELIMANVESRMLRLNQNMSMGSAYGDKLADYQRSQAAISRQMYELGVDLFGIFQPFITFVVDVLTGIISIIGFIATLISLIVSILDPILKVAGRFFRDTGEYIRIISNWLTGSKDQEIPNYTKEFMQNDPRQNFIHHE